MNAEKIFDKDSHTIGEFYDAVLGIDDPESAAQFFDDYAYWLRKQPDRKDKPECIARANIGWVFGEGMTAERVSMWSKVCNASHPAFGVTVPTFDEALQAGKDAARRSA